MGVRSAVSSPALITTRTERNTIPSSRFVDNRAVAADGSVIFLVSQEIMTNQRTLLLNIAIALLIVLNGFQLYGILSGPSSSPVKPSDPVGDTLRTTVQINVLNGCGVNGVGSRMTAFCRRSGYDVVEMGNYRNFTQEHSLVIDRSGNTKEAHRLADLLGIARENVIQQFSNDQMVTASVVIGRDYQSLTPWK